MEAQIQQAVEIAFNPSSSQELKQQALTYIDEVKSSEDGWQACLPLLYNNDAPDPVKLFVFQIIDQSIPSLSVDKLDLLKGTLMEYFKKYIVEQEDVNRSPFLKNKLAATFSYLFYYAYMNIWPGFFQTFIKLIENDATDDTKKLIITDYYLRILLSVHSEIGDQLYQTDPKVMEVSNSLKDLIRMNDMEKVTVDWKYIITFVGKSLGDTANEALKLEILKNLFKVIGSWVSWIDINLIIANNLLENFYQFFEVKLLRNDICDLFIEIISKKMPSEKKMELIDLMKINDIIVTSIDKLNYNDADSDANDPDEVSFYEHVAKLINAVGLEYLIVIEKTDSVVELKQLAFSRLNVLLPYILRILPNDYDDISFQVFPLISSFLAIAKKISKHDDTSIINLNDYNDFLSNLLTKIILKMKYDEEDDGLTDEDEDEDAQEFQEIRNKLKVFQDAIATINPDLFVSIITNIINETLFTESNDWRTFELGLFELSNFSDILRNNSMKLVKQEITKSKPYSIFQSFLLDLINKKNNLLVQADHPLIQLTFLDLIIKHYNFFVTGANSKNQGNVLTNNILEIINSKYGLFHENSKVQKRCFYLFSRFIKLTKPVLEISILKTLLSNIALSLLLIKVTPSTAQDINLNQDPNQDDQDFEDKDSFFESQLYLFETVGLLISLSGKTDSNSSTDSNTATDNSTVSDQEVSGLMDMVLNPLFNDLKQCMDMFPNYQLPLEKQQIILQAHHCLVAIGTFGRGFEQSSTNVNSPNINNKTIISKFQNAAEAALVILDTFQQFKIIRDSVRFAFSRFMPILNASIKDYLARLISIIIANENITSTELINFISFINQIVYSFSKDITMYQLLNELLGSLLQKIFKVLESFNFKIQEKLTNTVLKTDPILDRLKNQKQNVQKSYLTFIVTLINNHVFSLLVNETNQKSFPLVLETVLEYINNIEETMVCKLSFNILENFITLLSTGALNDKNDIINTVQPNIQLKLDGVEEYLLKASVSACFEIPFKNTNFNVKDAQSRLILNEISFVLKVLFNNYKEVFISYLTNVYFVEVNFPNETANEFLNNLVNMNDKQFKQYFAQFVAQLK